MEKKQNQKNKDKKRNKLFSRCLIYDVEVSDMEVMQPWMFHVHRN